MGWLLIDAVLKMLREENRSEGQVRAVPGTPSTSSVATQHEAHAFKHGLRKSLTSARSAEAFGYLPLGCYLFIFSNCGGLSTMLPPIALSDIRSNRTN